ncbi:phage tail protein, partial [Escherichia coli]|nr:phage tail protein [Escherichia coli]
ASLDELNRAINDAESVLGQPAVAVVRWE